MKSALEIGGGHGRWWRSRPAARNVGFGVEPDDVALAERRLAAHEAPIRP